MPVSCSRGASHVLAYRPLVREQVHRRRLIQDADAAVAFMAGELTAIEDRGLHGAKVAGTHVVVGHPRILGRIGAAADGLKARCGLKARHGREQRERSGVDAGELLQAVLHAVIQLHSAFRC